MDRFLEMRTFCAVVDAGSFVGAAEALDLSKAAVSRHVGNLEERLGVRLLHRTTRRLSLTTEGELFDARCRDLLSGLDAAEAELSTRSTTAQGLLRINAPFTFGVRHLAPLWGPFRERYPRVDLDVTLADRLVDPIEEGFDVLIRITGALPASTLVGKRLAKTRLVACATQQYLDRHGTPERPADLAAHAVIAYSYIATGDEWHFDGPDGPVRVRTRPWLHSNNGDSCRAAALAHQGIMFQPSFLVGDDLAAGRLVELLPGYGTAELGIHVLYPSRKHVAPKVRALVDFLSEHFAKMPMV